MQQTLEQQANARDNDYSALEDAYRRATGGELVRDPYGSVRHHVNRLTLTASVIVPAWNVRNTLEQCLIAIEQNTFNRRYPGRLEVIVVDDGSTDGTWEMLEQLRLDVRLRAVRQDHHSLSHTRNTGIALAEGDVIIACDADLILAPFSIEELMKRHQVLDRVALLGFRSDISPADPRIQPDAVAAHIPRLLPPFEHDIRLWYHAPGWPESMCRDSEHLKHLGHGRHMVMPDDSRWDLPSLMYGALFSLRRDDLFTMAGCDERFYGWGCEDTLIAVRALAMGNYIIPVYSAAGWHVSHRDRSQRKWQEFSSNRRIFSAILQAPFVPGERRWIDRARARVKRHIDREPASTGSCNGHIASL